MNLTDFAESRRLRVRRAEDGEPIIQGRRGQLYEHGDGRLGLILQPSTARRWRSAQRKLEGAGISIWQNGDEEGSALFAPENKTQTALALELAGAKPKRVVVMTPERIAALAKGREMSRLNRKSGQEGQFAA